MGNTHHAFDYIELGATDLRASRTFYESAFGWNFNDYGPEYAGIRAVEGDGEVGGLTTLRAPGTAGPLVLLYSSDLDAPSARSNVPEAESRQDRTTSRRAPVHLPRSEW